MANIDKVKAQNYLNIHLSAGFYASGLESLVLASNAELRFAGVFDFLQFPGLKSMQK